MPSKEDETMKRVMRHPENMLPRKKACTFYWTSLVQRQCCRKSLFRVCWGLFPRNWLACHLKTWLLPLLKD